MRIISNNMAETFKETVKACLGRSGEGGTIVTWKGVSSRGSSLCHFGEYTPLSGLGSSSVKQGAGIPGAFLAVQF